MYANELEIKKYGSKEKAQVKRMKINPKAFATLILTALGHTDLIVVRIGIANALEFIFIL